MDIKSERRVPALDHAHGAGERIVDGVEAEGLLRAALVRAAELHDECLEHVGAEPLVVAAEDAQPPRERTNPLSDGYFGDDLPNEVQCRVGHAAAEARGAKSTALARKSYEVLEAAAVAADPYAAMIEQSASQEFLDFAHHEPRQSASLFRALAELRPVLVDGAVEHRLFGPAALVRAAVRRTVQRGVLGHGRTP